MLQAAAIFGADKLTPEQLLDLARQKPDSAELRDTLAASLPEADLTKGTAVVDHGPDFLFALFATSRPAIVIDSDAPREMHRLPNGNLWVYSTQLSTGISHSYHYVIDGKTFGGKTDLAAYLPESYEHPGVPQGKLSDKLVHTSHIYPGMHSDYWIYVPAQYDPKAPAALMVWQDGQGHIERNVGARTLNVIDNLIAGKKIPVMIQVFISPGTVGEKAMRSIEYDTVNDTYDLFLRDEILADVEKQYNIRKDSYSRGIAGNSSGGICSFNAAWFHPELFSRVLSRIGSFTSIQWHPGQLDGGDIYPFKIRGEDKRNIRVWLQDGANDLENDHGSWPLQNLQMANSLKMKEYDFHLSFGTGTHNGAHGNSEVPKALAWLWRDYDPSKTSQFYEIDPAEKNKPLYRVRVANRPDLDNGATSWPDDAIEHPAVPKGKLTEMRVHSSKIYPGMRSNYWVYTPAGYDPTVPAPLMVWQDGEVNIDRKGESHTLNVIDNLTAQKRIPAIVHLFLSPGAVGETKMRSIEYDTVDDTYARLLRDEVLPEISKEFNIRSDAYSRAIIGESSGGICSLNAAWFHPEMFSRVVSRIGSYASLQWHPGAIEGGNTYPFKIRKEPKRNIRGWVQDGANDLENQWGSWPLQNIQLVNSLKMKGYDFHFSFGEGPHRRLDGQMEAAAELAWIWRGYDPSKTEENFEMDPAEKDLPLFRVAIAKRE